ncbi:RNA polymerase sigma factor [Fulvivirga sp. 1062]|uniref:RNA polymerase sigma factor n=2 Tax=Fulvivirga sedimenti TaxID=2879465 RepID=A0A9X1HSK2_9BACT|nr:RNA polymerase sigma factor [Fulvivirga sedimenti]MCA6076047.1 RNA polymerase sigma factor [Fulvivirga sedimenti]MCA6077175.1 RNA polymerase sigma factor [Fulvivirga sedimenti]
MITENQGILHKICNAYTSPSERDDLFQEILTTLWQSIDSFQNKSKLSTWMYKVALFTALNYQRKEKLRSYDPLPETVVMDKTSSDEAELVQIAIQMLRPEERALLILQMEDYSYDEIAEIVGISVSNVGARLTRIRKKLKEIIEKI